MAAILLLLLPAAAAAAAAAELLLLLRLALLLKAAVMEDGTSLLRISCWYLYEHYCNVQLQCLWVMRGSSASQRVWAAGTLTPHLAGWWLDCQQSFYPSGVKMQPCCQVN
jgi:hypothetical protein